MKARLFRNAKNAGFTLIELVVVILTIALFSAVSMTAFKGLNERRDAEMVMSAQATLQAIVTQGATRLDIRPSDFNQQNFNSVLVAARHALSHRNDNSALTLSTSGRNFTLLIPSSDRGASFTVNTNGVVELVTLRKFSDYKVDSDSKSLVKK